MPPSSDEDEANRLRAGDEPLPVEPVCQRPAEEQRGNLHHQLDTVEQPELGGGTCL